MCRGGGGVTLPPSAKKFTLSVAKGTEPDILYYSKIPIGYFDSSFTNFGSVTPFGALTPSSAIKCLYCAEYEFAVMAIKEEGETTNASPNSLMMVYGPENRYTGFSYHTTEDNISMYVSRVTNAYEGIFTDIKDCYFVPYLNTDISVQLFTYNPEYSKKVEVKFYYGYGKSARAVDTSIKWMLAYSDDLDNPIKIFGAEITPDEGTLVATLELDTYRDACIYLTGFGYDTEYIPLNDYSGLEYYDPASYRFMITQPCSITIS